MHRLEGIDPGVKMSGWAIFEDGHFGACGIVRSQYKTLIDRARSMGDQLALKGVADEVVCEHMQHYKNDPKSFPNDLIAVELVGGILVQSVASRDARVWMPTPREWKGTTPKDIHNDRIRARCPEAVAFLAGIPKSFHNHALDAVGLCYWRLDTLSGKE